MSSIVTRIRGRSLAELRVRGTQALHVRLERFAALFTSRARAPRPNAPILRIRDDGIARLAGRGTGIEPAAIARAIAQLDPQLPARLAERSDAAERGWISLLGHEALWVGNPPHWNRDAVSAIEAPECHWSRIDHLDSAVVGDHKVLWELNRHQYLLAPAICWLLEGDARRFALIESHLESWLSGNPPRRGVNWVSSLELGFRAIVWCWLLWMLRDAPWQDDLRRRLALSLEAHARHIERYLSTYFSPNTHLTGEALALFYVGTLLPDSRHALRWRRKGAAILEAEIGRQVYADGVYFEQATQYQRYTAEIYLHYLLLASATGWSISATVRKELGNLCAVLRSLASGGGLIPLLGDDDGGLLLPFDHRPPDDVRGLLLAAAVALERPELSISAAASPAFAYWLCGIDRTDRLRTATAVSPDWLDMYFAHGGLAVLRDGWGPTTAVGVIDAGPHGALSCGHAHADALAMTLALGSTELLIDRGTLTYSGPERNEFRSTVSHNTLEIDGTSSVMPGRPFKWQADIPAPPYGVVWSSALFSGFFGLATGHVASGRPSSHCRRVLHHRGGAWVIHDRGVRAGGRCGVLRWQLAPQLTATALTSQSVAIRNAAGIGVASIYLHGPSAVRVSAREVSLRLGQRSSAQCLELETGASLEALTIVVPARSDGSLVGFEVDESPGEREVVWSDDAGRHRVVLGARDQALRLPVAAARGTDLLWRVNNDGKHDAAGALIAAMPPPVAGGPGDARRVSEVLRQSGRMTLLANTDGRWVELGVQEPRRG